MALDNLTPDQHQQIIINMSAERTAVVKGIAGSGKSTAASLLSDKSRTTDNANLWYTTVTGADASYLKSHDGVLRIYNDPGSYYNYKTIAIRRGAFENCDDLQAVEFWQTNGRSNNSYSEPKMVIENGAFKNCRNLKEIRLFYKVEDGDDRWQVLGPKDVIPGNNIFGMPTAEEIVEMEPDQADGVWTVNPGFRILVAPDRYAEFKNDPNWAAYIAYLHPADYMPSAKPDITKDGLTYGYIATGDGTYNTDQVVTQDFSLWSIPVIIAEVAMIAYSAYNIAMAVKEVAAAKAALKIAKESTEELVEAESRRVLIEEAAQKTTEILSDINVGNINPQAISELGLFQPGTNVTTMGAFNTQTPLFKSMLEVGLIDNKGFLVNNIRDLVYAHFKVSLNSQFVKVCKLYMTAFQLNSKGILWNSSKEVTKLLAAFNTNVAAKETAM